VLPLRALGRPVLLLRLVKLEAKRQSKAGTYFELPLGKLLLVCRSRFNDGFR
jgi:hypothetical protein